MQHFISNILNSKAPLMVVLRIILGGAIAFMGLARLRLILMTLSSPISYQQRDILQEYLMAKALVTRVNPYLPLDKLAEMFIGKFPFLSHPAPYPPFVALISTPLLPLGINQLIVVWLIIELVFLAAIAAMLTVLWKGKINWIGALFIYFLLLAWYPVMVDLLFGQMTIILTTLVLAALLALRKNRKVLAGILIGFSVALKMFTWPIIIYFAIKKDWRAFISSAITVIGLNLLALAFLGFGPVSDYYLRVTIQVTAIYHSFLKNYSLWSIGYRLFEGTRPVGNGFIYAPPLVNLPKIAPIVSAGLAILFLVAGLIWARRAKDTEIAYSIMVCVLVGVSPIAWDHYYIMLVISIAILLMNLSRRSFPNGPTIISLITVFMILLFNEFIYVVMFAIDGGPAVLQARGYQISFSSSLLETLPMIELVVMTILLWRIGSSKPQGEITPQATNS